MVKRSGQERSGAGAGAAAVGALCPVLLGVQGRALRPGKHPAENLLKTNHL